MKNILISVFFLLIANGAMASNFSVLQTNQQIIANGAMASNFSVLQTNQQNMQLSCFKDFTGAISCVEVPSASIYQSQSLSSKSEVSQERRKEAFIVMIFGLFLGYLVFKYIFGSSSGSSYTSC